MMLKAKSFFSAYDPSAVRRKSMPEKITALFALYEDGEERLRFNRKRDFIKYRDAVGKFLDSDDWTVTTTTRESLLVR